MEFDFKPISCAPVGVNSTDQILCRFWYPYVGGNWVYFVCYPAGEKTKLDGYSPPEEWCYLPEVRKKI